MNEQKTNLAWRLSPGTVKKLSLESPGLLVAGSSVIMVGAVMLFVDWKVALAFALGGLGLCAVAFVKNDVPKDVEPLKGGTEGYRDAVQALEDSCDEEERKHVFLGTIYGTMRKVPYLFRDTVVRAHVLVLGASGSMKTWKAVMAIISQLLSKGNRSLIYVDLSGDDTLLWALCLIAGRNKMKFKYFTLEPDKAGHVWPIFDDSAFTEQTPDEQTTILTTACGMESGDGHGTGYFGTTIERFVRRIFKRMRKTGEVMTAYLMLAIALDKQIRKEFQMSRKDIESSTHATGVFERLTAEPRMNCTGMEDYLPRSVFENKISIDEAISEPTILLFNLSMLKQPPLTRSVARLLILIFCGRVIEWQGPRVEQVYVCIDEFAEIAHRSLETPMRQIRKFGASFIYVFQNLSDLRKDGQDLTHLVINNSTMKVMMTAKDFEGRNYITSAGGEVIRETKSTSKTETSTQLGKSVSVGTQIREEWVPRFGPNELNELNNNPDLAIVEAPTEGLAAFGHPVMVEMAFPYFEEDFKTFQSWGWPRPSYTTTVLATDFEDPEVPVEPVAPSPQQVPPSAPAKRRRPPKPVDPEQVKRAAALAERLRQPGGNTKQ
ncbi:MAG: type IV secretory system conjugative DNA transfer family protein [Planctomycetota bacterium]|nr:type IV secretory system conjugative DNA transfer family protein [Planctomycetota bacterium]